MNLQPTLLHGNAPRVKLLRISEIGLRCATRQRYCRAVSWGSGKYRSNRWLEFALEILHERIRDLCAMVVRDPSGRAFDILHQPVEVVAGIGDADHADGGAVPEFGCVEFRDRNVERSAQPV